MAAGYMILLPGSTWLGFARSFSLTTWAPIAFLLMVVIFVIIEVGFMLWQYILNSRDDSSSEAAWKDYGKLWLGLYTPRDEAINGLRSAIGMYFTLPPIGHGRIKRFLRLVLANTIELPLNHYLRIFAQGGPGLGGVLEKLEAVPVPDSGARGPMPPELEAGLTHIANETNVRLLYDAEQLETLSRKEVGGWNLVEPFLSRVRLKLGLYHTSYYEVDSIRRAIAYHILDHASNAHSPQHSITSQLGLDNTTIGWLRQTPSTTSSGITSAPRPRDLTPVRRRLVYLIASLTLVLLACVGIWNDFVQTFIPNIIAENRSERDIKKPELVGLLVRYAQSRACTKAQRLEILSILDHMHSDASPATDYLIAVVTTNGFSDEEVEYAIRVLGSIGPRAKKAVPALKDVRDHGLRGQGQDGFWKGVASDSLRAIN